ncbi:MAG: short-chain fatty acyl-CoA regulator family protein [Arhodomonas sp.]|nr:short-chain fatty acyl-CoA regulator family protein [Arhodomonas sp.]
MRPLPASRPCGSTSRRHHGVTVSVQDPAALAPRSTRFHTSERTLLLSEALPETGVRFALARTVARLDAPEVVAAAAEDPRLTTEEARQRCREALYSYFAGALLFPYEHFLTAAEGLRYDIERLQQRFGGSFEQVCHRLCTLRRAGREGIPFHFVRTDIAGNIDKRFSASGLRLPHYGGACPRWVLYSAFRHPGETLRQLARMPDGTSYLFVARALTGANHGFSSPRSHYSVMIGCDMVYARDIAYADGLSTHPEATVEVGVSCRHCPREACAQRAHKRLPQGGEANR